MIWPQLLLGDVAGGGDWQENVEPTQVNKSVARFMTNEVITFEARIIFFDTCLTPHPFFSVISSC